METKEKSKTGKIIIICLIVAILIVLLILFLNRKKENSVDASINYTEQYANKKSIDVIPLSNEHGMIVNSYHDFTVNTKVKDKKLYYEVLIAPKETNKIDTKYLRTYLTDQNDNQISEVVTYNALPNATIENNKVLYRGLVIPNSNNTEKQEVKNLRLRMWLDEEYPDNSMNFPFELSLNAYYVEDNYTIPESAPLSLKVNNTVMAPEEAATTIINTEGDGTLSCASSDETVATCSISGNNLTVYGHSYGEAIITITQAPGTIFAKSNSTEYSVSIPQLKLESEMTLSAESGVLFLGTDNTVTIVTNGDGTLNCASSDETVATCAIEEGVLVVTPVATGNATITVSQTEGEKMLAPKDVIYTITDVKTPAATTIGNVDGLETTSYGKIYGGADPSNYLTFNNELWRIIGVYGDNIKIIRSTPYTSDQVFNNKGGSNAWDGSAIQEYLYNNYETIINDEASRSMVLEDATWYVGAAIPQTDSTSAYNDAIKTEWKGKIGLIASFEYQFASPSSCWANKGSEYNKKSCGKNNWLFTTVTNGGGSDGSWTMTPDDTKARSLRVHPSQFVDDNPVDSSLNVSPVVFLKKTVAVASGTGTQVDPYVIN